MGECGDNTAKSILDSEDMKKLFVSKIPLDVTDEELKSFLEGVCGGNISDMTVIRKPDAKTYHFGFLTFDSSQLVDEVIFKEKELVLNGGTLRVKKSDRDGKGGQGGRGRGRGGYGGYGG